MRTFARAIAYCAVISFTACGTHHGDGTDHDDSTATLSVAPATSELMLTPTTPGQEAFTALATYPNGDTRDVTSEVTFGIDSTFGSFMGTELSMVSAGKTVVTAVWAPPSVDVKSANAQVIGRMNSVRADPTLPGNIADLFDNATEDAARAPTIVYPQTGVIIPRNLGDFESHWIDATGNDTFELSLTTEFSNVRIFVPGGNGEAAAGAMPTWASFLAIEWIAAVGREQTVTFKVRGLAIANPTTVGSTPPQLVKLTNEEMQGGLYYWGIYNPVSQGAPQVSGIWRHDMAQPDLQAEEYMSTNTAGRCVACHVLSRDGTKMAITYDGGNRPATIVDVASKAAQPVVNNWNFGTFTPDGDEIMGSFNGTITIRKASDQSVVMAVPTGGYATHPDMSADGRHIAYVDAVDTGADWHFGGGRIMVIDFDQATHTFGSPRVLVDDASNTINNYYPSWSPDNKWLLFNRSSDNDGGSGAYNNPSATLWVVRADGTGQPILLATANNGNGLTNSWGRWAPFGQTVGASNKPMYWVTTSSKRTYGVRRQLSENWPSIWMFPFFPDDAAAGGDPTGVAFRLPFQDFTSHNHIAQWTEKVVVTQ